MINSKAAKLVVALLLDAYKKGEETGRICNKDLDECHMAALKAAGLWR